jgi:hypothetical protein
MPTVDCDLVDADTVVGMPESERSSICALTECVPGTEPCGIDYAMPTIHGWTTSMDGDGCLKNVKTIMAPCCMGCTLDYGNAASTSL